MATGETTCSSRDVTEDFKLFRSSSTQDRRRAFQTQKIVGGNSEDLLSPTSDLDPPSMCTKMKSVPMDLRGEASIKRPTERLTFGHDEAGTSTIVLSSDVESQLLSREDPGGDSRLI